MLQTPIPLPDYASDDNELALYVHKALDHSLTAFVIVDQNQIIRYVNQALINFLNAEMASFKQKWSRFNIDKRFLIGFSITQVFSEVNTGDFSLSDQASLPWNFDIVIGDACFNLAASAILDEQGLYAGNLIELNNINQPAQ